MPVLDLKPPLSDEVFASPYSPSPMTVIFLTPFQTLIGGGGEGRGVSKQASIDKVGDLLRWKNKGFDEPEAAGGAKTLGNQLRI